MAGRRSICASTPDSDSKSKSNGQSPVRAVRRKLSSEDRRAELLAIGAELFGQQPYDQVQIDNVAEQAGISRTLIYHYFPDKRAFFAAIVKQQADQLIETTNQLPLTGQTLFDEVRAGVVAYMEYQQQHPHSAWAAYVGIGRSDPMLLGIDDDVKNRQAQRIMTRIIGVESPGRNLDPELERDLAAIVRGWLAFTCELCRQRIIESDTDAGQLADACAHTLLDAVARMPGLPAHLVEGAAPDRR